MDRIRQLPPFVALWRFIFMPAARYPADPRAVFILALSAFSGMVALAVEAAPPTLAALLPDWGVTTWSLLLVIGSIATLVGMLFQNLNGILVEQVGSIIVGVAAVFYSTLAVWVVGLPAFQTVGIIFAWGLSCFIRWIQLQALIVTSYHQGLVIEVAKALEDEHKDMRGE
jgi:hypothetical protein